MTRPELPDPPERIARLRTHRGYPVPWFVADVDGVPDFRVIKEGAIENAVRLRLCWVCGQPTGGYLAYVAGPMCALNRTSAEPPCHRDCAIYSAIACPFLTRPHMRRRDEYPDGISDPAGVGILRNPGVALVWVTRKLKRKHRVLFDIGDPVETLWFAHGREATRDEVEESIASGLPLLLEEAAQGREVTPAMERHAERQREAVDRYLPARA